MRYNEILLSHKEQPKCAICRDVDGPRDCNTQWSKLEKENIIFWCIYVESTKIV